MAATPLVLLHPFPFDATFWDDTRALLERGRTVLAPDFPGFGHAAEQPGWGVDDAADAVAGLITREAGGRAAVCGLSLGGYVAMAIALRHPQVVAGLVLANTRAEADDEEVRAGRDRGTVMIRAEGTPPYLDGLIPRLLSPDAPEAVRRRAREIADPQPGDAVCAALDALRDRPDRRAALGSITAPALVIAGADDALTPPALAEVMVQGIPGAESATIAGAGHLSALERPEEFAARVDQFLRERVDAAG